MPNMQVMGPSQGPVTWADALPSILGAVAASGTEGQRIAGAVTGTFGLTGGQQQQRQNERPGLTGMQILGIVAGVGVLGFIAYKVFKR
jgi:hypothetical protein